MAQAEAYLAVSDPNALVGERLCAIGGNGMDGSPRTNAELLLML